MIKGIADTLNKLENVAAAEMAKTKGTDKAFWQTKQHQLALAQQNVKKLEEAQHLFNRKFPQMKEAIQKAIDYAKSIADKCGNVDGNGIAILKNNNFNQDINQFNEIAQCFRRNVELKKQFVDCAEKAKDALTAEKEAELKREIEELAEEEEAVMMSVNLNGNFPSEALREYNKKWAALLKRVFNIKDLPELKETTPVKKNDFAGWGQNFIAGLSSLFKALNDPALDSKGKTAAFTGFIGTMIQFVVGLFGNLFKSFLGKGADTQINDLTNNITSYFTNMLTKDYTQPSEEEKKKAQEQKNARLHARPAPDGHPASTMPSFDRSRRERNPFARGRDPFNRGRDPFAHEAESLYDRRRLTSSL